MLLQAFPHRLPLHRLTADHSLFFKRRNIRWGYGDSRSEDLFEHPFAAHHRRGSVRERRNRQNAALAEQAKTILVGQRYAPERVSEHTGNAVVLCKTLIDESV